MSHDYCIVYILIRIQDYSPSIHMLRLDQPSPEFYKLKSFLKNVFASFEHMKSRQRILDTIPRAGYYEFKMWIPDMTIQVCPVLNIYPPLLNDQQYYCPDIVRITLKGSKKGPWL